MFPNIYLKFQMRVAFNKGETMKTLMQELRYEVAVRQGRSVKCPVCGAEAP